VASKPTSLASITHDWGNAKKKTKKKNIREAQPGDRDLGAFLTAG